MPLSSSPGCAGGLLLGVAQRPVEVVERGQQLLGQPRRSPRSAASGAVARDALAEVVEVGLGALGEREVLGGLDLGASGSPAIAASARDRLALDRLALDGLAVARSGRGRRPRRRRPRAPRPRARRLGRGGRLVGRGGRRRPAPVALGHRVGHHAAPRRRPRRRRPRPRSASAVASPSPPAPLPDCRPAGLLWACAFSYIASETLWKAACSASVLARISSASSEVSDLAQLP